MAVQATAFNSWQRGASRTARCRRARRLELPGRSRSERVQLPWTSVPISGAQPASAAIRRIPGAPAYAWLLVAAVLAAHALAFWYLTQHSSGGHVIARKTELNLQIVAPPPPKPPPPRSKPKPQPPKRAQVLPPIRDAEPLPSDTPAAPTSAPPVAVAPIVSAPPPPPPKPVPVTQPFGEAGYLNNPAPDYPLDAERLGWAGTVTLHVHVLASGKPDRVEVQQSSGHKPLDAAAVAAVKRWTFAPARRGSQPIDGWAVVPIEFQL